MLDPYSEDSMFFEMSSASKTDCLHQRISQKGGLQLEKEMS